MRWPNDTYVSTPRRVASPRRGDRHSVLFFLDPDPDAVVACLPSCRGGGARYAPVVAADYLKSRLDSTYSEGYSPFSTRMASGTVTRPS